MKKNNEDNNNLGSIFKGLDKFINIVSDMIENHQDNVSINGSLNDESKKNNIVGKYGVNIRLGGTGSSSLDKINTLGNIANKKEVQVPASKVIEPSTDVFYEEDSVIIVMELPVIDITEVDYELQDNILTVKASYENTKYYKNINLKFCPVKENITASLKNSIYSILIKKGQDPEV